MLLLSFSDSSKLDEKWQKKLSNECKLKVKSIEQTEQSIKK